MKKIVGLMIVGVATACFADALSENRLTLDQKRYSDAISAFTQS